MAFKIFTSIKTSIYSIFNSANKLKITIENFFKEQHDLYKRLKNNLKNLSETNLNLGKYHLMNRNLNDAILRFKMVDQFLDKDNNQANYYLGWCYILKGDYDKALVYLAKSQQSDDIGLKDFANNYNSISSIPPKIDAMYRDIIAVDYIDKFASDQLNLVTLFVHELNTHLITLPSQYNVLELRSNIGILGHEINKRLPDHFHLTGVEPSKIMIGLQQGEGKDDRVYDTVIHSSILDYFNQNNQSFDVIVSLDGFGFIAKIDSVLPQIKTALKENGVFAFITQTSNLAGFNKNYFCFLHDESTITKALVDNGFEIQLSKQIKLEKNNLFSIFIVKKT